MTRTNEIQEAFYEDMDGAISEILCNDKLMIGKHGMGKTKSNGRLLLHK